MIAIQDCMLFSNPLRPLGSGCSTGIRWLTCRPCRGNPENAAKGASPQARHLQDSVAREKCILEYLQSLHSDESR